MRMTIAAMRRRIAGLGERITNRPPGELLSDDELVRRLAAILAGNPRPTMQTWEQVQTLADASANVPIPNLSDDELLVQIAVAIHILPGSDEAKRLRGELCPQ